MSSKQIQPVAFGGNFHFTPVPAAEFGEDHATLVVIAGDVTGSLRSYMNQVRNCIIRSIKACVLSPFADFLLTRVTEFDEGTRVRRKLPGTVREIVPFTTLGSLVGTTDAETDQKLEALVPQLVSDGNTPLIDAVYDTIKSVDLQGRPMRRDRIKVNGVGFIIADGGENCSKKTYAAIAEAREELTKGADGIESFILVLIGVNTATCKHELEAFKDAAGIDYFIDAGEATEENLAKVAGFIAELSSSTSQACGSGKPSQNVPATI